MIGDWARTLLAGTWLHACAALIVLVAVAAALQREAPQAETFAQTVSAIRAR